MQGKGNLAKAFPDGLSRWPSFSLFQEDGRIGIANNPAGRTMRPIAIGKKLALRRFRQPRGKPVIQRSCWSSRLPSGNGATPQNDLGSTERCHNTCENQ
ncbi:IS66 family transposase [Leisingera caerulea]|nr:IS66 family transposase [Leisingera caerulea]